MDDLNGDGHAEPIICGVIGQRASNGAGVWNVVPWAAVPQMDGQTTIQMQATNALYLGDMHYLVMTYTQGCMGIGSTDGKADLVWHAAEYWKGFELFTDVTVTASYGTVTFTQEGANVPLRNATTSVTRTADVDGDGNGDMIRYDPSTGGLYIWLQRNKAFAAVQSTTIDAGGTPYDRWFIVADVNGDGLSDMVLHTPADGKLKVWLSKGDGTVTGKFETTGFSTGGTPNDTWFLMADVNADGRADAVKYTPSSGNIAFAISYGDGTFGQPINASMGPGYTYTPPTPSGGGSGWRGIAQFAQQFIATGFNPTPTVGPNPTTAWFQPADVNGDGLPDWVIYHPGEGKIKVNLGQGAVPDLLLSITDGHGAVRDIVYKPLTDPAVYTKGGGAIYPVQDVQNATYVVSETAADDGTGGQYRIAYRYEGARMHLTGRGFLGFAALEQTDLQTGIVTRTQYRQDFPYIGQSTLVTQTTSGGIELKRVENTHAVKAIPGGGQFVYLAYNKEQSKDLNGAIQLITETWNTYGDDWGNLTQTIVQTSDGFKKQTDSVYTNDAANWLLGRLTRATVTSTANTWAQTRVSTFEYAPATGLLKKEIVEPDQPQYRLDTAYTFDAFGNRVSVTVSSPATGTAAIVTRATTTGYDPQGRFPTTVTNALGHTETRVFDARFGAVTSLTGPNNLTTAWQYDGFGRKTRETRADGTYTVWTYAACDAACPAWGVYRIVTQVYAADGTQAAPASVVYFDKLNRETRTATQGFDGRWIYKDTVHDPRGNVDKLSRPYYAGDPVYWIDQSYDDLNRLVQVIEPDNPAKPALVVDYNGLTVTRTNRKDQITVETRNSQGQKISVTDAMGQTTLYNHDPFGNLTRTTDPAGNQIVNVYDVRGRKTQTTDPDLGAWTYAYNALGELVKQTDAKGQVSTMTYDTLGRMTQRVEPGLTSTWTWDTAAYGKGKLKSARVSGDAVYSRVYSYDALGRIAQVQSWDLDAGGLRLDQNTAYDTAGRILAQTYPSGFVVKNVYNALGYLVEVRDAATNNLYWQQNAQDAEGHILQETYGNGIVTERDYQPDNGWLLGIYSNVVGSVPVQQVDYLYDTLGNVRLRSNDLNRIYDINLYDSLNRLTKTTATIGGAQTVTTVAYDALGNLTSKSGVGDYYYGSSSNCAAGSNAGPHAVCKAGSNTYAYDLNGNLTAGGGRVIGWTAWNMPASLTQGGQTTTWRYGPEHDRYKMIAPGRTTWYLNPGIHQGGHYERTQYANGTVEHRHTLYGGGQPIGEVLTFESDSLAETRYFHSDAQGSITAVTDANGAVLARYRYDPWGKQTLVAGSNTGIDQTRQGHTGHEMLDGGLTHMNGRLYDPLISRFVSADLIVQQPYNLQSLNRYSYVLNNPLGYTDPSGYFGWEISPSLGRGLFMLGGVMFGAVLGPAGPIFAGGSWATTLASGALAGGVSGFIASGGNAQAAKQGALAGGLFAGAGLIGTGLDKAGYAGFANDGLGRALLHAGAGCISANAGGGSCGSGALQAGFTKFASANLPSYGDVGNLVKYAVIGGTASAIGGGKFANGAMTGAWQYLFNEATQTDKAGRLKPHGKNWVIGPTGYWQQMEGAGNEAFFGPQRNTPQELAQFKSNMLDIAMVGSSVVSGGTAALIWAGRGTAAVLAIDTAAGVAGMGLFVNDLVQATNGGSFPVSSAVSATTGFFGDQALRWDGYHVGGPIKLIGPVIDLGTTTWRGLSQ